MPLFCLTIPCRHPVEEFDRHHDSHIANTNYSHLQLKGTLRQLPQGRRNLQDAEANKQHPTYQE